MLWLVAKPLLSSPDEFGENERIGGNGAHIMFLVTLGGGKEDTGLLRSVSRMAERVKDVIPDLSPQS